MTAPAIHVPERFRREVILHVTKNVLAKELDIAPPLILGIHGPSGQGKSFQTDVVLRELQARSFLISGGQFENYQAGEPARLVRQTYLSAGDYINRKNKDSGSVDDYIDEKKGARVAVVLINDIDTGIGSWGQMVQYTVNRQTTLGELMHLVDYPESVDGFATTRVPIIVTGNDFTKLYEPLVRAGRMTSFLWDPTHQEKCRVVERLFPDLDAVECAKVVGRFEDQPLSFFAFLKSALADEVLWKEIEVRGPLEYIRLCRLGRVLPRQKNVNYHEIIASGEILLGSGKLVNHLRE